MITQAFLAGGATLVAAYVLHRLWLAALPRTVCPDCGEATVGVSHPLSARTDRWLRRRWCSACGWVGWGRNGPVLWRQKGPISHGSGFRWGADRLEPDHGFQWAGAPKPAAPPVAPAHPSGFRWAGPDGETETVCTQPVVHPSGFRFRPEPEAPDADRGHPSGFRWAEGSPLDAVERVRTERPFRWAEPAVTSRSVRGAQAFRWKD